MPTNSFYVRAARIASIKILRALLFEADFRVIAIEEAVHLLARYPALGRPGRVEGTRGLVVPDTPHVIPYRVRRGRVEVLRILHAARKWPRAF